MPIHNKAQLRFFTALTSSYQRQHTLALHLCILVTYSLRSTKVVTANWKQHVDNGYNYRV